MRAAKVIVLAMGWALLASPGWANTAFAALIETGEAFGVH